MAVPLLPCSCRTAKRLSGAASGTRRVPQAFSHTPSIGHEGSKIVQRYIILTIGRWGLSLSADLDDPPDEFKVFPCQSSTALSHHCGEFFFSQGRRSVVNSLFARFRKCRFVVLVSLKSSVTLSSIVVSKTLNKHRPTVNKSTELCMDTVNDTPECVVHVHGFFRHTVKGTKCSFHTRRSNSVYIARNRCK